MRPRAGREPSNRLFDCLIASNPRARKRLQRPDLFHRARGKEISILFDRGNGDGEIDWVVESAVVEDGVVEGIGGIDQNGATAEWLEQDDGDGRAAREGCFLHRRVRGGVRGRE